MYRQLSALIFISIAGLIFFSVLHERLVTDEVRSRVEQLHRIHSNAVNTFSTSVNQFAILMSGMRSYIHESEDFPSQEALHNFLVYQTECLNMQDSLIVSYLNTEHEFVYSFTPKAINPAGLIGKNVRDFRDHVEIKKLDSLLLSDDLQIFLPINLVEGWVGIPLNFRIVRGNQVMGYIASIINFRNIITPVDLLVDSEEFAMRFEVKNGIEFDREQAYDGSTVYHTRIDSLSARRLAQPIAGDWLSSEISLFGQEFIISTAYRKAYIENPYLSWVFIVLYALILGYLGFALYKIAEARNLNQKMRKQNVELKELNKTKDRFFSIIGHDLRGPLGNIISLMNLVENDRIDTSDIKILMQKLSPAANNTINLMEDLLRWAQINNKDIDPNPSWVQLDEIIDQSIDLTQPNANMKDVQIHATQEVNNKVWVDKDMIATVIRNILLNAIKFSQSNKRVFVRSYSNSQGIVVEIEDEGIGMDPETIEAIKRSKQRTKKGTQGEKGYGLGLTISKAFIEKHKGYLEIQSTQGNGSLFKIVLPQPDTA